MATSQSLAKKKKAKAKKKQAKLKQKKGKKGMALLSKQEQRALKKQRDRQFRDLKQYVTIVTGCGIVLGLLGAVIEGEPLMIAAAPIGLLALALSYKYPRKALWIFFIYLPFGGTVTYFIGNSPALQLAKDGFYFPALYSLIQYCRRHKISMAVNKPIWNAFSIMLGYCCLVILFVNGAQQLDPKVGGIPIAMGILGLKVFLGYAPLMLCVYFLIKSKEAVIFLMRLSALLVIICCGLSFVQYVFLLTGICAPTQGVGEELFKASLDTRCLVGGSLLYTPSQGVIRLPGTFVAPWQWGWFMISGSFMAFAVAFNDPKIPWRVVGALAMAINFGAAVISGQRIALALVPITTILLLVLTGQLVNLKRFIPLAGILGVALTVAIAQNPALVSDRVESFQSRWQASPPHSFITHQIEWALNEQRGFLGNGLGRATNSARVFGKTHLVETYYPKLMFEIGVTGALLFLGFVTVITIQCFQSYRSVNDPHLRGYGAALWVFVLV
ncbi:MAG: hormogonium polysaccharide biosynthesis protein HpsL, partial [Leptolyngbyaceae bacterium]|nr:hormogonium polysaccharide biosynthesis protein HpsL [Leptolyngbyaceae bacterium]